MRAQLKLRVGDWVEVRPKEEILRTLDRKGQLEGMPFMPEMFDFCGKRYQVLKRAHKSCDPDLFSRRIARAVHLETRCDGGAHGGCEAGCRFFWKEAWLKRIDPNSDPDGKDGLVVLGARSEGCSETDVWSGVQLPVLNGEAPTYVCQTTQVPHAGELVRWWDIRQYLEDYSSGNESLRHLLSGFVYSMYYNLSSSRFRLGPVMQWFYGLVRPLWGGVPWPRKPGIIPDGQPTPAANLNLQPGELVRVKSQDEILRTANTSNKNRGLWWDAELVPYCGGTYRVLRRVSRILDEKTGKMQEMKTPCIVLDSVICRARYSANRMFCPHGTYAYWREIWLERIAPPGCGGDTSSIPVSTCAGTCEMAGRRPGSRPDGTTSV